MHADLGHPALLARTAQADEDDVGTGGGNAGRDGAGGFGVVQTGQILEFAGRHESVAGAGNAQARPDGPHVLDGQCI